MILVRHGQSEFNEAFEKTGKDPGIRDPHLTEKGRDQVRRTAEALRHNLLDWGEHEPVKPTRILTSPYSRALQTATILAEHLSLPMSVTPLVGEWAAFTCDLGMPRSVLAKDWPHLDLDHLGETWWPELRETEEAVTARAIEFRKTTASDDAWPETLVVSHWGFIRALTGHAVTNAAIVRLDPTHPHPNGGTLVYHDQKC